MNYQVTTVPRSLPREGRTVRVAVAQLPALSTEQEREALRLAVEAIGEAGRGGAHLVVLPECSWPGYLLERGWSSAWPSTRQESAIQELSAAARRSSIVVVVGMALADGGTLRDVAVTIESDGTVTAMTPKEFLWDFDRHWFSPGANGGVVETSVGRLGILVCADGRVPEIARRLAVAGAELLVDCTALPTSDPDPTSWTNPQQDFVLPTRAAENRLWLAAANKVGIERQFVAYTGGSCVIDANGGIAASASRDRPETIMADIPVTHGRFPVTRRPELYGLITAPVERTVPESPRRGRLAVANLRRDPSQADVGLLNASAVDLVVWPQAVPQPTSGDWIVSASADEASLVRDGERVATWHRTHGRSAPGNAIGPVVDSRIGPLAVILGPDGWLPEVARILTLQGARTVVWMGDPSADPRIGATRAAENRIWLVATLSAGGARVFDPDGRVRADAGALERIVLAYVDTAPSRIKELAPGSDVLLHRRPDLYHGLVEASEIADSHWPDTGEDPGSSHAR